MTARELINELLDCGCSMNTEVLINLNEPHKTKNGWSTGFHFDIEKVVKTGSIIEITFKDWRVTEDDE